MKNLCAIIGLLLCFGGTNISAQVTSQYKGPKAKNIKPWQKTKSSTTVLIGSKKLIPGKKITGVKEVNNYDSMPYHLTKLKVKPPFHKNHFASRRIKEKYKEMQWTKRKRKSVVQGE